MFAHGRSSIPVRGRGESIRVRPIQARSADRRKDESSQSQGVSIDRDRPRGDGAKGVGVKKQDVRVKLPAASAAELKRTLAGSRQGEATAGQRMIIHADLIRLIGDQCSIRRRPRGDRVGVFFGRAAPARDDVITRFAAAIQGSEDSLFDSQRHVSGEGPRVARLYRIVLNSIRTQGPAGMEDARCNIPEINVVHRGLGMNS